ncbi:hypothetical protein KI387_041007, partial [Taxus chinensis]
NKANHIGLYVKRKTSSIGHPKVSEALIVASYRHKSVKRMRREKQKPKPSYLRTSNVTVSEKENQTDYLQNPANLDHDHKLHMVDEDGVSYTKVISEDGSLQTPRRDAVLKACVVTSGIFAVFGLTIRQ